MTQSVFLEQRPVGWTMDWRRNRARMGKLLRIARVQANCNMQGMWIQEVVRSDVAHAYCPLLRPRCHRGAASNVPRQTAAWVQNWSKASKTCASIPQDTTKHNRRELVAICQG